MFDRRHDCKRGGVFLTGDVTVRGVLCVWQKVYDCKRGGVYLTRDMTVRGVVCF